MILMLKNTHYEDVISVNSCYKSKKIKANNTGFIINRKPLGIPASLTKILFLPNEWRCLNEFKTDFYALRTCHSAGNKIMGLILFNNLFQNKLSGVSKCSKFRVHTAHAKFPSLGPPASMLSFSQFPYLYYEGTDILSGSLWTARPIYIYSTQMHTYTYDKK